MLCKNARKDNFEFPTQVLAYSGSRVLSQPLFQMAPLFVFEN